MRESVHVCTRAHEERLKKLREALEKVHGAVAGLAQNKLSINGRG